MTSSHGMKAAVAFCPPHWGSDCRTCGLYCLGTRLAMAAYTPLVVVVTYVNSVT
jgi:hypothetical protein